MYVQTLSGLLIVSLAVSSSQAQHSWVRPYSSLEDSPFHEFAMPGTFVLEDFEAGELTVDDVTLAPLNGVQRGMVYITSESLLSDANSIAEDTGDPKTGSFLLGVPLLCGTTYPPLCPATVTFQFDDSQPLPTFAGLVWTDAVRSANPDALLPFGFVKASAGGEQVDVAQIFALPTQQFDDVTADDLFIGVVDYRGIDQIEFQVVTDREGGYLAMDHLQFGAAAIQGDANLDGIVEFQDFLTLAANFGDAGVWATGDFTFDGLVDFNDFLSLSAHFGERFDGQSVVVSVPEPNASGLAFFCGMSIALAVLRGSRSGRDSGAVRLRPKN